MPLDPLLASPSPIKIADPMEQYGELLKNQFLQSEIQKARTASSQNVLLNKAYQMPNAYNADKSVNFTNVANNLGMIGGGQNVGQLSMDAAKTVSDQAMAHKNQAEGDKFDTENYGATLKQFNDKLSSVSTDPQIGLSQMFDHIRDINKSPVVQKFYATNGVNPNDAYVQGTNEAFKAAQAGPDAWKAYLISSQSGLASGHKMVTTQMDLGNRKAVIQTPETGGSSTMTANMPVMMTPEQQQKMQLEASKNQYTQLHNGQTTQVLKMPVYGDGGAVPVASAQQQLSPSQQAAPGNAMATKIGSNFVAQHVAAQQLPQTVSHIDDALGFIKKGPITGAGQTYRLDTDRIATLIGMDPGTAASNTQLLNKKLNEFVLDQMRQGNTGRTTNMLQKLVESSNASGTMEPSAIRSVLLSKRADYQNQMNIHNTNAQQLLGSPDFGERMKGLGISTLPQISEYDIPPAAVAILKAHPDSGAEFDKRYGQPGAAARILQQLGGTPTGAVPFPVAPDNR